jgi:hypothetical protein
MACIGLDHLVRSTGVTIIVIFLHTYLIAENGTEHEVAKQQPQDDEENSLTSGNGNEELEGLNQAPRLSTATDVSSTEQRLNEIQDHGEEYEDIDGEI